MKKVICISTLCLVVFQHMTFKLCSQDLDPATVSFDESRQALPDLSGMHADPDRQFQAFEGAQRLAAAGAGYLAARIVASLTIGKVHPDVRDAATECLEAWDLSVDAIRSGTPGAIQQQVNHHFHSHGDHGATAWYLRNLVQLNLLEQARSVMMRAFEEKGPDAMHALEGILPGKTLDELHPLSPGDETFFTVLTRGLEAAHKGFLFARRLPSLRQVDREAWEMARFLLHHEKEEDHDMDAQPYHQWVERGRHEEEDTREDRASREEMATHAVQRILTLSSEQHHEAAELLANVITHVAPDSMASRAVSGILPTLQRHAPEMVLDARRSNMRPTHGNTFFEPGKVRVYELELSDASIQQLHENPKQYVRGTFREGSDIYAEVGIRLKGGWGSFRMLDGESKAAFTIKFNAFVPGQRFHGLRRIVLNNGVQDPSYMREAVAYSVFRDAGIAAPGVAHAMVSVNDIPYGLYIQVEAVTKDYLKGWFGNASGNLYEGPGDVMEWRHLDLDTNQDKGDRKDLRDLARAIEDANDEDPWQELTHRVSFDDFSRFLALEQFMNHWDGYTQVNNYRIYSHPVTRKFHFMPHGADQVFEGLEHSLFRPQGGVLGRALLLTESGESTYRKVAKQLLEGAWNETVILQRVALFYARLRPYVAANRGKGHHSLEAFDHTVQEMIQFISMRRHVLERQLERGEGSSWREGRDHEDELHFLWD
jgi:hypothetical protein